MVVVVGAGIGGLSAALDLASRGHAVTVLEKAAQPGGKARAIDVGGHPVDVGPTVLTMRWVFEELFARAGTRTEDCVELEDVEILARHAWMDGSRLDLFADRARSADAIGAFAGPAEARRYLAFAAYAQKVWEAAKAPFVLAQRPSIGDVLRHAGVHGLGAMMRIDGHRTMWKAIEGAFEDPRLRQLFARYATYCGASPWEAPATFNLVSHVESEGVARVRGGISALAAALAQRAEALGARFRYGAEVRRVVTHGGRVRGVELADGEIVEARAAIVNADIAAVATGRLGALPAAPPAARSLSAITFAAVGRSSGGLVHHNVAFSSDYAAEFSDLFDRSRTPREPTVYVCAQDRTATGEERFFVIVNAPATGDRPSLWSDEVTSSCERVAFSVLERCGFHIAPRALVTTTPVDFERLFPATGGALYGPRPRGPLSSFAREGSRSKIPGLYFAGGSVHPGPGVPMVALSGRLAAASLCEDLDSTARSRRPATSGITSMA